MSKLNQWYVCHWIQWFSGFSLSRMSQICPLPFPWPLDYTTASELFFLNPVPTFLHSFLYSVRYLVYNDFSSLFGYLELLNDFSFFFVCFCFLFFLSVWNPWNPSLTCKLFYGLSPAYTFSINFCHSLSVFFFLQGYRSTLSSQVMPESAAVLKLCSLSSLYVKYSFTLPPCPKTFLRTHASKISSHLISSRNLQLTPRQSGPLRAWWFYNTLCLPSF